MRVRAIRSEQGPVRLEESRTAETRGQIELTEREALEANLLALGISGLATRKTTAERIFETYVELTRENKRIVGVHEVGEKLNLAPSGVSRYCSELVRQGKMFRVLNSASGKNAYVPKVV